jgi:hypothetical protein
MCAPVESGTGGDGADSQPRFCAIELRLGPATRQSEKWEWNFGLRTGLENTWTYHKGNDRLVRLRLLLALI